MKVGYLMHVKKGFCIFTLIVLNLTTLWACAHSEKYNQMETSV
jgi:hypothetical protein